MSRRWCERMYLEGGEFGVSFDSEHLPQAGLQRERQDWVCLSDDVADYSDGVTTLHRIPGALNRLSSRVTSSTSRDSARATYQASYEVTFIRSSHMR